MGRPMENSELFTMLKQAGEDVPIPKNLSSEYREVLDSVISAQKILDSVGGSYGLQLWMIPRPEFEEEFPTLDFLVNGFTQASLSLMPTKEGLSGFMWKHESMNMGGYQNTNLPVFNSPWSLIFQLLWLTHDLVDGCTDFIGQEVQACDDFKVIDSIRHLVASGMLPADGEIMLWAARTYLTNSREEEYESNTEIQQEQDSEDEPEDECINDGDCSGSCDSCARVRSEQKNNSRSHAGQEQNIVSNYGPPDPNDTLCGLPSCQ